MTNSQTTLSALELAESALQRFVDLKNMTAWVYLLKYDYFQTLIEQYTDALMLVKKARIENERD